MDADESRREIRRGRAVERAALPVGPACDLRDAVYRLYAEADCPRLDDLATAIAKDDGLPGAPRKDLISKIVSGDGLASQQDTVTVAVALAHAAGRDDASLVAEQVRRLWIAARTEPTPPTRSDRPIGERDPASVPYGMIRVHEAPPRLLGVHAAIRVDTASRPELPAYVPRDVDVDLRTTIRAASERGGLVLLVGGSSSGKTRTLVEAVQESLPDWWLLHPATTDVISTFVAAPVPRTVLWLDELQNYLDSPVALSAGTVRGLITAGTVVVATMWGPEYADRMVPPPTRGSDPNATGREILGLASVINIPDTFSAGELGRAEDFAGQDPRIRMALDSPDAGVTQVLAGGPQLVERWNNADPYARAILAAAVDAVRLGVRSPLPAGLLQQAAPGYCDDVERAKAPADWFEQAVAYATRLLLGAVAPLAPVANGMTMGVATDYRLADYLRQHAQPARVRLCPPAAFWDACLNHLSDQGDLERLGHEADRRMRYCYAIPLLRRAHSRDPWLVERLGWLIFDQGDFDEALSIFHTLARTNPLMAARLPAIADGLDGARSEFDRGIPSASAQVHMLKGLAGSRAIRRVLAEKSPEERDEALADIFLLSSSDHELRQRVENNGIISELRQRVENDDVNGVWRLVDLLAAKGDIDHALPAIYDMVDWGLLDGDTRLIAALVELGRSRDAQRLARFGLTADRYIASPPAQDAGR